MNNGQRTTDNEERYASSSQGLPGNAPTMKLRFARLLKGNS